MRALSVEVISPEGVLFEGKAFYVSAPGSGGGFGLMYNHIPFSAALSAGSVVVNLDDEGRERNTYAIRGGFLQLMGNHVTILAEPESATGG